MDNIIFVKDGFNGNGLYTFVDDNIINQIKNCIDDWDTLDGIICFKCNSIGWGLKYVEFLSRIGYFVYFGIGSIEKIQYIDKNNIKIAIISLDTESG